MRLSELLRGCETVEWIGEDVEATSVSASSAETAAGSVFVCLSGGTSDGHDYATEAVARGAVAVVSERKLTVPVPQVVVKNTRSALARMAAAYYGHPAKSLKLVAVLGTNGKTTTAHMIAHLLEFAGVKTCLIGTNGMRCGDVVREFGMTTPDPLELQRMLSFAVREGCGAAVLEASAHAVYYAKLDGTVADVAVFTNFSQDHLDFFKDMATYAATKASFFTPEHARAAVINSDDALGLEIAMTTALPVLTYGVRNPAEVFAIDYTPTRDGSSFVVNCEDEIYGVSLPMHGEYNRDNALAAIACGSLLGLSLANMAAALAVLPAVSGRYQTYETGGISIVVDYAHTPDGVAKILDSIREWAHGRVIAVFGCGGNRDREKRPLMARAAEARADFLVVTSDNPRFEEPSSIVADVCRGLRDRTRAQCVVDREEAIRYAVGMAQPGDVVAILGKGSEPYLDVRGEKRVYSDVALIESIVGRDGARL